MTGNHTIARAVKSPINLYILLGSILILSASLRLIGLDKVPPGFYLDESAIGVNAQLIAKGGIDQYGNRYPVFFRALDDYKAPAYIYSTAFLLKFVTMTETTVRIPAALWGILGILAAFFLARMALDKPEAGLLVALLLCLSPWHIQYSRMAWEATTCPVLYSLALLFIFKWMRTDRLLFAALAGMFCALTLYSYTTARLLIPMTLIVFGAFCLYKKLHFRPLSIACFLLALVVISLPFAVSYLNGYAFINHRTNFLMLPLKDMPSAYLSNLDPRFLFVSGDSNPRHSIGHGLVSWYLAPFLIAGIIQFLRSDSVMQKMILVMFFLTPVLGSLSREYPHATRVLTFMPLMQIIAVSGIYDLSNRLYRYRGVLHLAIAFAVATTAILDLTHHFGEYRISGRPHWAYGLIPALRAAKSHLRGNEKVHILSGNYIDWMFVDEIEPSTILSHRELPTSGLDTYDPFDSLNKYAFLRCVIHPVGGNQKRYISLASDIWVLPTQFISSPLSALYQNEGYSVLRGRSTAEDAEK